MTATQTTKATPKTSPIYVITFKGEYFTGNTENGKSGYAQYQTDVRMTEAMAQFNPVAIWAQQEGLGHQIMQARYPDYRHLQTFHVVNTVREDGKLVTDMNLMSRNQLIQMIKNEGMKINTSVYKTAEDLKDAIIGIQDDPVGFRKAQQQKILKASERDLYVNEALALNNLATLPTDKKIEVASLDEVMETKRANDRKAAQANAEKLKALEDNRKDIKEVDADYFGGESVRQDVQNEDEYLDGAPTYNGKTQKQLKL